MLVCCCCPATSSALRCCTAVARSARCVPVPSTPPGVLGLAAAVREAVDERDSHASQLAKLRDELIDGVRAAVPDVVLNGDPGDQVIGGGPSRLPGNAHFTFPGCEGDSLLMLLDAKGIECSTGSACTAGVSEPSHVLLAMGADPKAARGSLRFSLGHSSTAADVKALTDVIGSVVQRARGAGLAGLRRSSAATAAAE